MIMVDQLWLCVWVAEIRRIKKDSENPWEHLASGVLTSFPNSSYQRSTHDPQNLYRQGDVLASVMKELTDDEDFQSNVRDEEFRAAFNLPDYEKNKPFRAGKVASLVLSAALNATPAARED